MIDHDGRRAPVGHRLAGILSAPSPPCVAVVNVILTIRNNGAELAETNYWQSEQAACGFLYLTWNAGCARLLVPPVAEVMLPSMTAARAVVISRGPLVTGSGVVRDALEVMFVDGVVVTLATTLSVEQSDRLPGNDPDTQSFDVAVWTARGKQVGLPGRSRLVSRLPCLETWPTPVFGTAH